MGELPRIMELEASCFQDDEYLSQYRPVHERVTGLDSIRIRPAIKSSPDNGAFCGAPLPPTTTPESSESSGPIPYELHGPIQQLTPHSSLKARKESSLLKARIWLLLCISPSMFLSKTTLWSVFRPSAFLRTFVLRLIPARWVKFPDA